MRPRSGLVLALLLSLVACWPRTGVEPRELPPLIPLPATFSYAGSTWTADARAIALLADPATANHDALRQAGVLVSIVPGGAPESYRLDVTSKGAVIQAGDSAGAFYGLQTLRQLVEAAPRVRGIHVEDAPRFRYRGMHLDVARHFMPVAFVKRYIDLMSRHKLNTFHWHLTDDQGWRIEIRKYPRLTAVGGCRRETMVAKNFTPYVGDGTAHCGFYTQDEVRDVVAYARQRHVTVIPEIEMPGHAKAALSAYPNFACTPGPFEVRTTWGVDEDIFCPSEETFAFIDDVLGEVTQLFPGRYVHIGGDEVPKKRWRESSLAQDVMRRENLATPEALQSWFIRRVERMLVARGKRLIGWDEILEGGLAPEATVMSWRGTAGGIAAAREGHDVIMTPGSHLYFDAYQGDPKTEPLAIGGYLPLSRVYEFEPVPDSLTVEQARHILGAQANLWSEYLKTPAAVEYMAWPRALALAEVVWSPRDARSWASFSMRLPHALASLDRLGVGYRLPDVSGLDGDRLTLSSSVQVTLGTVIPGGVIRYTTDGSDPTLQSPVYAAPFTVPVDEGGVRVTARAFARNGRASAPRAATYRRTSLLDAAPERRDLQPGLAYTYHEIQARRVIALDTARVVRAAIVQEIARRGDERPERYGIRFEGFLRVPADDLYEFALTSDDGSTLVIAGRLVVDNDDFHGAEEKTGMIALRRGLHPFVVRYAQATGGAELSLRMRRGDGEWRPVPGDWLFHAPR
jgi:hexosaminidase